MLYYGIDERKEAHGMKVMIALSKKRASLLLLCFLLIIMVLCGTFLLRWRRSKQATAVSEPIPVLAVQERTYVSKFTQTPVPDLPSPRLYSPAPSPAPTAVPTPAPTAEGLLGGKYAWRFTDEEVLTDHSYSDPTISISWDVYRDEINYDRPVTFYIADVLVQDVTSLRTAFAKGEYKQGGVKPMESIAKSNNCIVAISGDFALWHANGLIVRNGEVFRDQKMSSDLCVIYRNGTMETYEPGTIANQDILDKGPWQSWHFGPELLDHEGRPKKKFNTGVWGRNPRSVIGYYEPGHYCLVLVDGRQGIYSGGLNMPELSELMYALGCVRAYNLDGGATAHMTWGNKVINSPSKDRKVHDVICVCFPSKS